MKICNIFCNRSRQVALLLLLPIIAACNASDNNSVGIGIAPTVAVTAPVAVTTAVPINSRVSVTFSEAMDAATLNNNSFTVVGAGEAPMAGTVSLDASQHIATFIPGSNFTASTVYTATLTNSVKSANGNALAADYVWTFTTGTTADTLAPTVASTNPLSGATGFALNHNLTVNFSEALDPATVNNTSFTLKLGAAVVAGVVTYSNKVATFTPDSNLATSTVYTATLTTDIADLAIIANTLATSVVWSFTTGATVATGPAPVNLRTAGNFVALSKSGITNVPTSAITGNIGSSPITAKAMDNVTCVEMAGTSTIYGSNAAYTGSGAVGCFAGTSADNTLVANAVLDMVTAYNDAAGRTTPDFTELYAGNISGQILVPGLYKWSSEVLINTDVTLKGSANDVWIFQIAGDVTQANGSKILLNGGALAKNIFWQVAGGTGVAIGTTAHFEGVVLAIKGITVNTGASLNSRLLAQTAITLDQNTLTQPAP